MKNFLKRFPLVRRAARVARRQRRRLAAHVRGLRARLLRLVPARLTAPGAIPESRSRGTDLTYSLLRVEWRDQGATPHLLTQARSLARNTVAWSTMPSALWIVFVAALWEAGDRVTAEQILRTYLRRSMPLDEIARCLPVARFARDLDLRIPAADRSAAVADVLDANRDAQLFRTLVTSGTIAVVGNGPGNLDTGRGPEIDGHDLVIRFNNYPDGFAADYGTRTDIWVRGAHREVVDRVAVDDYRLVVWEMDLFRNMLEVGSHADILYRDTLLSPDKVTFIDTDAKQRMWQQSGLLLPTSGAQILWAIHDARGSLEGVDVYGFSTLDDSADFGHFFDSLGDMGKRHDTDGEAAFLRSLFPAPAGPAEPDTEQSARPAGEMTIFSCAYREYDPANGKTGGPGGVLATQQYALGDEYRGQTLRYLFRTPAATGIRRETSNRIGDLSAKVSEIIIGSEFIRTDPEIMSARAEGRPMLLVCHELGTAYGAQRLGIPYVLVYHQQGSTVQEMRSIGRVPTDHEIYIANRLERLVCDSAEAVFFPSLGARDTYLATSDAGVAGTNFADWALYNTVSAADHAPAEGSAADAVESIRRDLHLPVKDADTDVFISVGDFNADKGLDRVPALLDRHARLSGRKVVWIAIGAAPDHARFAALMAERKKWAFDAHLIGQRTTHDRLLALLDYADYYVMMHRNSIFDLATLEAMRAGKPLILSPVGGNVEVDLDGNVLFVDEDSIQDACRVLESRDRAAWGERNRRVFEEHLSLERFAERYRRMLDEQIDQILAGSAA